MNTRRLDPPRLALNTCLLRAWQASDVNSLARHANNARVAANLTDAFPHPYTEDDARRWIEVDHYAFGWCWAIEIDGGAVGGCSVRPDMRPFYACGAEVGYWLAEPYWGRGVGTEVVGALSDFAFALPGVVRVYAPVLAHNTASMRVLEKNGFVREGILRASLLKGGRPVDQVLYARIKPGAVE